MAGKPKAGFYIAIFVVVAALIGLGVWRFAAKKKSDEPTIDPKEFQKKKGGDMVEAPDGADVTTVKEYEYVASQKLPPVEGSAGYKPMKNNTIVFSINVWAGWAPIIYANEGFKPKKKWKTPDGKEFMVELKLIDDIEAMRNAYAAGDVHIGWATVDMLPLIAESLWKDSRVRPRVFQQIDWSNGGDGIVARADIKQVGDLRGKTIVLAQNSPSHYFVLNSLLSAGVQPNHVNFKFTKSAFGAARAYATTPEISAAASWAPDIYNLSEVKGNKLLVSTLQANKLIADVWYARADFAKDHPKHMEGLVRGIFDAMEELKSDEAKAKVAEMMAKGFSMPADEAKGMLADAHWTNYAENRQFFLNQNNPTNFSQTYGLAQFLYKKIKVIDDEIPADQMVDFSVIKKLGKEEKYAKQKDEYTVKFTPASASTVQAESSEILTKTVVIRFYPNSYEINKMVVKTVDGKEKKTHYDPNAKAVIDEIARLAGQYGAARIVIEGHADSSMQGKIDEGPVRLLSENRANAVKQELVNKKKLQANQFSTVGKGWSVPADPTQPKNHLLNRRVEVKVYPLESPE
jgi:NitT/TauT family transport system substrate-binding protein